MMRCQAIGVHIVFTRLPHGQDLAYLVRIVMVTLGFVIYDCSLYKVPNCIYPYEIFIGLPLEPPVLWLSPSWLDTDIYPLGKH